jgi:hypothetical protein
VITDRDDFPLVLVSLFGFQDLMRTTQLVGVVVGVYPSTIHDEDMISMSFSVVIFLHHCDEHGQVP